VWAGQDSLSDVMALAMMVAILVLWLAMVGLFFRFRWHVAPSALQRWAEVEGYRIVEQERAGIFDWLSFAKGNSSWVIYRVVVLDETGQVRSGLARVGSPYGPCLSPSRCPVEARWDSTRRNP
jgi:hypothetical protein